MLWAQGQVNCFHPNLCIVLKASMLAVWLAELSQTTICGLGWLGWVWAGVGVGLGWVGVGLVARQPQNFEASFNKKCTKKLHGGCKEAACPSNMFYVFLPL